MTEINEEILEIHSKNKMKNKGIDMDDRGDNDLEKTIDTLRSRIKELMSINTSHQDLMGKLIKENEELKRDNKSLAKQIGDYFNAR
jgi:predicted  nucleic acid-binding Zn-ribbon protein